MDVVTGNYWAGPIFSLFSYKKLFFIIFAYSLNKNKRSYETQKSKKILVTGPKNLNQSQCLQQHPNSAQSTVLCFTAINHLHRHLRKLMFTSTGSRGHLHVCECNW